MEANPTSLLEGRYVWDCWFIRSEGVTHMYALNSPSDLPSKARHHHSVCVDHWSSKNQVGWRHEGRVLEPGPAGSWDSADIWTGCTVEYGDGYLMYYTGLGGGGYWSQGIGVAYSKNLHDFRKAAENPVLMPDGVLYSASSQPDEKGVPPAFRDPYLFKDEISDKTFMYVSAKNMEGKACIGVAEMKSPTDWTLRRPVASNPGLNEMELPQVILLDGTYYCFYSSNPPQYEENPQMPDGLYCHICDKPDGVYEPLGEEGLVMDYGRRIFGARIIEASPEGFNAIAWVRTNMDGGFSGGVTKPFKLKIPL